jgi:hypothetical protein
MRWMLAALAMVPMLAHAEDWRPLDGPGIALALAARTLAYPDGAVQDFLADGRTLQGSQWVRWEVRGDRYCSIWPPSDRWTCYAVAQSGLDIRFTAETGAVTVGRYADL